MARFISLELALNEIISFILVLKMLLQQKYFCLVPQCCSQGLLDLMMLGILFLSDNYKPCMRGKLPSFLSV